MNSINNSIFRLEQLITRSWLLKMTGGAYLIMTVLFLLVMKIWDFHLIDETYAKDAILAQIEAMSDVQKYVHAITTATLDVIYPFAYGIFQAGMAFRYLGPWGKSIGLLSLVCIPVDLIEGFTQVMLLTGSLDYVGLKTLVTPIKLILYLPGLAFALVALGVALRQSRLERK